MSLRQFLAVGALIFAINLARELYGGVGLAVSLAAIGVVGLGLALWYERRRAQLRNAVGTLQPEARDEVLVALENDAVRADLEEDLDVSPPRVPLRAAVEEFRYPVSHQRPLRWTMNGALFMSGFFALGFVTDRLFGTERFYSSRQSWTDAAGTSALMFAIALALAWFMRELGGVVLVSDDALELHVPGRRARRIAWGDVKRVQHGTMSQWLVVSAADERIRVGENIEGYGRLLNLVRTRVPRGAIRVGT